ncbi:MAG: hypothetical protein ACREEY_17510 [Brevundimonas sp.]
MKDIPEFRSAEMSYVVANTPTFLARKLREDEDVVRFAKSTSSVDILASIADLTRNAPTDLRQKYLPIVLLGALSSKGDRGALRAASVYDRGVVRWYHEVLDYLLQITPADNVSSSRHGNGEDVVSPSATKISTNSVKL